MCATTDANGFGYATYGLADRELTVVAFFGDKPMNIVTPSRRRCCGRHHPAANETVVVTEATPRIDRCRTRPAAGRSERRNLVDDETGEATQSLPKWAVIERRSWDRRGKTRWPMPSPSECGLNRLTALSLIRLHLPNQLIPRDHPWRAGSSWRWTVCVSIPLVAIPSMARAIAIAGTLTPTRIQQGTTYLTFWAWLSG